MPDISITPTIEVTIGRQTRLYHAFITTAPAALDAPSTLTLYAGPLKDVAGFAVDSVALDTTKAATPSRLVLIDTTELKPIELREELRRRFGSEREPVLTLVSFGFANGISRTADLVFDMRFLANPYWVDELRPLTGAESEVRAYIAADPAWAKSMAQIETLLTEWIPRYWAAGKTYLTIAFGCTGGRHRSVTAAVEMAERLEAAGFAPIIRHRDLGLETSDRIEDKTGRSAGTGSGAG